MEKEIEHKLKNRPYIVNPEHSQEFKRLLKETSNDPAKIAHLEKCKSIFNKINKASQKSDK